MTTFDSTTMARLELVYPDLRVRWIRLANDYFSLHGIMLKVAQGLRTYQEQQAIYEKGRVLVDGKWMPEHPDEPFAHDGIVTWAKPGDSWHHFCAIDSCFAGADPFLAELEKKDPAEFERRWAEYARLAAAHGLKAGYNWPGIKKDRPHVQIRYGAMTLAQAKELYAHGKLTAVWSRFDQIRGVRLGSEWSSPALQEKLRTLSVLA